VKPDVVVVGAGAAGIFAAWRAASLGAKVVLVEKTARIGTKISISGGGKCNVAHAGPIEDVLKAFRPNEARFIRPACYRLKNDAIVKLMTDRGLRVYTRDDGRVFPIDKTAKDVVAILRGYLDEAGVEVRLETPVEEILAADGRIAGVKLGEAYARHGGYKKASYGAKALLNEVLISEPLSPRGERGRGEGFIECPRVILATGGSSYPNSGTTGDGWPWVAALGHTVVKVRAALAPVYLRLEEKHVERSGIALRNPVLRARLNGKEIVKWQGDLLFTHQGISGPAALGISRTVAERQGEGEMTLEVDLLPHDKPEEVTARLMAYASEHPRRLVRTFLEGTIPDRLIEDLMQSAEIEPTTPFSRLEKKARNRLANTLKGWPLGPVKAVPLEKGEVVAGGVSLDEVDPQTMRSKLVEGLYLCGEVLDIAGPVGGYNLQAAFATGYVAGETAALDASGTL
jgi:hypothetical protein